jgi:hypothetical protein
MSIRVVANETVPAVVYRQLQQDERRPITVRRHLVVPSLAAIPLLADLVALGLHAGGVTHGSARALTILWVAGALSFCLFCYGLTVWLCTYFVVTQHRLFIVGWWRPWRLVEFPLTEAEELEYIRPFFGLILGYGTFSLRRPGSHRRRRKIRFLPYPEQLYIEVCGLICHDPGL